MSAAANQKEIPTPEHRAADGEGLFLQTVSPRKKKEALKLGFFLLPRKAKPTNSVICPLDVQVSAEAVLDSAVPVSK